MVAVSFSKVSEVTRGCIGEGKAGKATFSSAFNTFRIHTVWCRMNALVFTLSWLKESYQYFDQYTDSYQNFYSNDYSKKLWKTFKTKIREAILGVQVSHYINCVPHRVSCNGHRITEC